MSLTDTKIRHIKPKAKPFKLFDEKGLYLLVTRQGTKCWRFKYRFMAAVGREWFAKYSPGWVSSSSHKVLGRLEKDVFPWLGSQPIAEIKAPDLLTILRRVKSRDALEIAYRIHQYCSRIFRYGIAIGKCERDIEQIYEGRFLL